jgi:hypothetical protein
MYGIWKHVAPEHEKVQENTTYHVVIYTVRSFIFIILVLIRCGFNGMSMDRARMSGKIGDE